MKQGLTLNVGEFNLEASSALERWLVSDPYRDKMMKLSTGIA